MSNGSERFKIDVTQDIKAGMGAYWDNTAKVAKIMPAGPTTELDTVLGIFVSARRKLREEFDGTIVYEDRIAILMQGPGQVLVDGAVKPGELLVPSASIAGYFTPRTFGDMGAAYDEDTLEAEIKKQAILPRVRAVTAATASGQTVFVRVDV